MSTVAKKDDIVKKDEVVEPIAELKAEIVKEEPEVFLQKSFANFINDHLKISNESIKMMELLLNNSPSIFSDIEVSINNVVKDGKIDSADIPELTSIIRKLYEIVYTLKIDKEKRIEVVSTILKMAVKLLVFQDKINIEKNKREWFLNNVDTLIDTCVELLIFSKSLKPKRCWKKLFR